jgi:signal transduction histidine kinase
MVIAEEGQRLTRFVADLLDFSGLRGGALTVRPEVNAVEDLLGAAIQQVSGAFDGRELKANIDTGEPILLARFDFVHALRILVNRELERIDPHAVDRPLIVPPALASHREGARRDEGHARELEPAHS